jgi:16S rRNA (cytosine967-C5)-methyltransferase
LSSPHGAPRRPCAAAPARRAALVALRRALDPRAPGLEAILDDLRATLLANPADAGLARAIAAGVLRNARALDHAMAAYLAKPLPEAAGDAQLSLLMGACQALCLDRIPPHAIVNEAVALLPRDQARYSGVVNAVLRRVVENREALLARIASAHWAVRTSMPEWIAEALADAYPGEAAANATAISSEPELHLRLRGGADLRARILREAEEVLGHAPAARDGALVPSALVLAEPGLAPDRLAAFREGLCTVIDEAAQASVIAAAPRPGMRVLDACAAPGGKSAALWDAMERRGTLTAVDVSRERLARMEETFARLGMGRGIRAALAEDFYGAASPASFDLVLVDAPCSDLGTMRRHPEVRWRREPDDVARIARTQAEILARVAPLVAPGGTLLFCVCTFTRAEGEEQQAAFLARHPEFRPAPIGALAAARGASLFRTSPAIHRCDAFTMWRAVREGA